MFERFTHDARTAVVGAQHECRALGHPVIETSHLLLSLLAGASPAAGVLRARGVTHERAAKALEVVLGAVSPQAGTPAATAEDDAAALAALGVDLERIRTSLEAAFGPGALERASSSRGRRWRPGLSSLLSSRRPVRGSGGHLPFGPEARKALELSLREALRLGDGYIGDEHLLLGLLRGGEATVAGRMLVVLEVDTAALRGDAEGDRRRSA